MVNFAFVVAMAFNQTVAQSLPEYTEVKATNYSAKLGDKHTVQVYAVCWFVNRKLQVWAPDGTLWDDRRQPQEMKLVRQEMEIYTSRIPRYPSEPFTPEKYLHIITSENGGSTIQHTLATERFSPSGGGHKMGGFGHISSQLFPGMTREKSVVDIQELAIKDQPGTPVLSFRPDLSDLPEGIMVKDLRIDKRKEYWVYHMIISGLPEEVSKRWFGIRSNEGAPFESKYPTRGQIAMDAFPNEFSISAFTQPKENPDRRFELSVCRTWKITYPGVHLRPNGWKPD